LCEIVSPIRPLHEDALGSVVYDRFAAEPDLLAIAVVNAEGRPVGLVERHAFSLRMATGYRRALYTRRPVKLLMDPDPLILDGQTQISAFTGETLSTHASDIVKGFIVVEQGRYLGVANPVALLQAVSVAGQTEALQAQTLADSASATVRPDGGQRVLSHEGLRVLAADDHPGNLKAIDLILGPAGCDLVSVENGALAVDMFQTQTFDVVLMDLQMAVMDGLCAIDAIRAWETTQGLPPCPILAVSANAMPEHIHEAYMAGADGHIAKPLTAAAVFEALDRLLRETGRDAEPQAERLRATA
jgi:CheY-like chemotaxis protein